MPGLMVTFINVGLNDRWSRRMAADPAMAWTGWDSYRRFLQSWAMSAGVDRDVFDEIMTDVKDRYGVTQKLDFTAPQMREIAMRYKSEPENWASSSSTIPSAR